jgi:hypothetical protein
VVHQKTLYIWEENFPNMQTNTDLGVIYLWSKVIYREESKTEVYSIRGYVKPYYRIE